MPAIRIYESALCCDTGVCGPDVDQALVDVTADVRHLQGLGADIVRHNLASEPTAFAGDDVVRGYMHTVGSKGLPLTVVDGVTVATGTYPSREQLVRFAGLEGPGTSIQEDLSADGATCDITCRPENSGEVCCDPSSGGSETSSGCCDPSSKNTEKSPAGSPSGCC